MITELLDCIAGLFHVTKDIQTETSGPPPVTKEEIEEFNKKRQDREKESRLYTLNNQLKDGQRVFDTTIFTHDEDFHDEILISYRQAGWKIEEKYHSKGRYWEFS